MSELFLQFTNAGGVPERLAVKSDFFTIGRHSENDLPVADGALSRQHLQIEKFGEMFVAQDAGSSNGTKINGFKLIQPTKLKNGDMLDLGGSFEVRVEIVEANKYFTGDFDDFQMPENAAEPSAPPEVEEPAIAAAPIAADKKRSKSLYLIASLAGILILAGLVGMIYLFSSPKNNREIVEKDDEFIHSGSDERRADIGGKRDKTDNSNIEVAPSIAPPSGNDAATDIDSPPVGNPPIDDGGEVVESGSNNKTADNNSDEMQKIEADSDALLRHIALNDPRAFLTGAQQEIVKTKINSFSNSAAFTDNLKNAKRNAAAIGQLAKSKSMQPAFLAAAALARLGSNRGDVLATAQAMAETLSELSRNIGNERADDNLLVIAAFEQGAAGKSLAMRDMLQGLTDKYPGSSRRIRTVWFLHENKLISDAEFDFALRFLAVGTIAQNPKNYNVNAEAVTF